MRIALVAPLVSTIAQPFTGGTQAFLADLAQGLMRRGHNVTMFARAGSLVPGVHIEPLDVPDEVQPSDFSTPGQARPVDRAFFAQANIFFNLSLNLQQSRAEFDLVHAHAFDWPAFALLFQSLPMLHTLHLTAISPEINEALRVLHRHGHPHTLITVSHACARTYEDYTPIDYVVYNGLDMHAIPFSSHIASDAPLLYAGRITPEKGVESAIEIAARAGKRLLIAGGIYDRRYYDERVAPRIQQGGERVVYLGQLERQALWKVMGQALGVLCPIEWDEPFGLIIAEAMATGTPVIAYRRGATEELILHGETGFLVEPGEREHAAALVDDLPDLPRARCRAHVEQHFSLEKMLDEYERIYNKVMVSFPTRF